MSEAFTVADMLSTIVLGIGIVFVILILLYLVMVVQHIVLSALENLGKRPVQPDTSAPVQPAAPAQETISDEETAVVLAVIAACLRCDPSALRLLSLEQK